MKKLWNWFRRKGSGAEENRDVEVEYLRLNFKARYHSFKLLISANNKSLENMADIERALQGSEVFGMGFIKSRVTAISVSVFSMISHLKTITGGKYPGLEPSFFRIEQEIARILSPKKSVEDPRLVIPFKDVTPGMSYLVGEKMAHAAEVKNMLGLTVPEGFAITATAYDLFMRENRLQSEIERIIQSAGPDSGSKIRHSTLRGENGDVVQPSTTAASTRSRGMPLKWARIQNVPNEKLSAICGRISA